MRKKLHELIEMARFPPRDFTATFQNSAYENGEEIVLTGEEIHNRDMWDFLMVTGEWTVRMKREPRVVWLAQRQDDSLYEEWFDDSQDSRHFGKPIKFIEVIE